MTNKGNFLRTFGVLETVSDVKAVESNYVPHPRCKDEMNALREKVSFIARKEFNSCSFIETRFVRVGDFSLRKNVGRKKGNNPEILGRVARSLEKGYNTVKLPPIVLYNEENDDINDWLVNGNHRWLWYVENGIEWMLVDVYVVKDGYDVEDVCDEVGLLHQPQPDGTESNYYDYKARGLAFVKRQEEKNIKVTQDIVDKWVDTYAINEIAVNRTNLKKYIFQKETDSSDLINYSARNSKGARKKGGILYEFLMHNIHIYDSDVQLPNHIKVVDRLYEGSQKVWVRDFLYPFLINMSQGRKTRINFYVNTSSKDVNDGSDVLKCISNRIKELENILLGHELAFPDSDYNARDYVILGKRPYQVEKVDVEGELQDLTFATKPENTPDITLRKGTKNHTKFLLQKKFGFDAFTLDQAYNAVRDERYALTNFKNEASFKGTIRGELQSLRDDGILYPYGTGAYQFV